jgi:hypothetical protein
MTTRVFRRGLFATALVGLAVRVAYILIVRRDVLPGGDSFFYHFGARLLVEGHGFIEPTPFINGIVEQSASHPPLYLLYLAIPTSVGLDGPLTHMLWSSLIGVGSILFVGLTGREVAGPRAGLVAAGLAATLRTASSDRRRSGAPPVSGSRAASLRSREPSSSCCFLCWCSPASCSHAAPTKPRS